MSLLEAMIVIAVLVVISAFTTMILFSTIETREALGREDTITRSARVTLEMLRREIQLAFLTRQLTAVNAYRTVFVGQNGDPDSLFFATFAHQRLYRDSRECDQTEITLWAEPDPDNRGTMVLYHREAPRVDEKPDEGGGIYPIARGVKTFNLRFLDSLTAEWVDEWSTTGVDQANRLPRAVEIGLVLEGPDPEDSSRTRDYPFFTTVLVQGAQEIQRGNFGGQGVPPDANSGAGAPGANAGGAPGVNAGGGRGASGGGSLRPRGGTPGMPSIPGMGGN
jgi:general secretion pathway protein J